MEVRPNRVVSITYSLRLNDETGEEVQTVTEANPLVFIYGIGNLLPKFEFHLAGKLKGDNYAFGLQSEDAYGPLMADAIVDIPIDVFIMDGKLAEDLITPGNMVNMRDQDGNPLQGKVLERSLNTVKVDFNHPMAGKNLHFSGKVIDIRDASPEELAHGHVHGPGGHHH